MARAGQRHVQSIEFFALTLQPLSVQGPHRTGRRLAFAGQKYKLERPSGFTRPVDQHAHGVGVALRGVGVEQEHRFGFQSFGAVNGQQAYGLAVDRSRGQHAPGFEGAHKSVGRGVAPAPHLQGNAQQRAQVGQYGLALVHRRCRAEAGQHVTIRVDRLQGVVRRHLVNPAPPLH